MTFTPGAVPSVHSRLSHQTRFQTLYPYVFHNKTRFCSTNFQKQLEIHIRDITDCDSNKQNSFFTSITFCSESNIKFKFKQTYQYKRHDANNCSSAKCINVICNQLTASVPRICGWPQSQCLPPSAWHLSQQSRHWTWLAPAERYCTETVRSSIPAAAMVSVYSSKASKIILPVSARP